MSFISVGGFFPPMEAAEERPEFDIIPPLVAILLNLPLVYPMKSFPQGDTSARQQGLKIRVFPFLGDLQKAIKRRLPVCQL